MNTKENGNTPTIERRKVNYNQLNETIEKSTKRWEIVVFPALFAFIILAAYGFYMIYSLATDVHFLSISVDNNMGVMVSVMQTMSDNMTSLTASVNHLEVSTQNISEEINAIQSMKSDMNVITHTMVDMNHTISNMAVSTSLITHDIHSAGRPMSFFNNFMPW